MRSSNLFKRNHWPSQRLAKSEWTFVTSHNRRRYTAITDLIHLFCPECLSWVNWSIEDQISNQKHIEFSEARLFSPGPSPSKPRVGCGHSCQLSSLPTSLVVREIFFDSMWRKVAFDSMAEIEVIKNWSFALSTAGLFIYMTCVPK